MYLHRRENTPSGTVFVQLHLLAMHRQDDEGGKADVRHQAIAQRGGDVRNRAALTVR